MWSDGLIINSRFNSNKSDQSGSCCLFICSATRPGGIKPIKAPHWKKCLHITPFRRECLGNTALIILRNAITVKLDPLGRIKGHPPGRRLCAICSTAGCRMSGPELMGTMWLLLLAGKFQVWEGGSPLPRRLWKPSVCKLKWEGKQISGNFHYVFRGACLVMRNLYLDVIPPSPRHELKRTH